MRLPLLALSVCMLASCSPSPTAAAGNGRLGTSGSAGSSGYNLSWGDGRRTVALRGPVDFTYTPVPSPTATNDSIREFAIWHTGEVRIRRVGEQQQPETYPLTAAEEQDWQTLRETITFDYGMCPVLPGAPQPYYTWVHLGGQYEGRPTCPPNPVGLTTLLAPQTLASVNGFLNRLSQRMLGTTLI